MASLEEDIEANETTVLRSAPWPKSRSTPSSPTNFTGRGPCRV